MHPVDHAPCSLAFSLPRATARKRRIRLIRLIRLPIDQDSSRSPHILRLAPLRPSSWPICSSLFTNRYTNRYTQAVILVNLQLALGLRFVQLDESANFLEAQVVTCCVQLLAVPCDPHAVA